MSRIIIAGGSGFLGRALIEWLSREGLEVINLSRRAGRTKSQLVETRIWDGKSLGRWQEVLNGAEALINLAGRSVDCRYHQRNRQAIMDSRINSTRVLGQAIGQCAEPPPIWLNSSTATIYKHTYGKAHDEAIGIIGATPEAKDAFSIEVATKWENEFENAETPATRKVALRTAIVLHPYPGGPFAILRRLALLGLGGRMGHGRQWVSWMHHNDYCRAVGWLLANPEAKGVYNLCSPNAVTNADLMHLFRKAVYRRFGLPATRTMLEIGAFFLHTETELILKSRRVYPGRLLKEGFSFNFPEIEGALKELTGLK